MKVLGKGSISSAIEKILIVIFIALIIALISGAIIIFNRYDSLLENNVNAIVIGIIYVSVFPGLLIIVNFIKIFNSLKNGEIFSMENSKRLKIAYIISLVLALMYVINAVIIILDSNSNPANVFNWTSFINGIYALLVATLFIMFGIGLIVLNKIYIKAIEYKNENDLTI